MVIRNFEEIVAWQKAQDLAVAIYERFDGSRDFGFRDQICRAAISISNNIAEGFDRDTDPEFRRFLFIARGSCSEVKSMIHLSTRLGMLKETEKKRFLAQTEEVWRLIWGLIKSLSKPSK